MQLRALLAGEDLVILFVYKSTAVLSLCIRKKGCRMEGKVPRSSIASSTALKETTMVVNSR